MEKFLNTKLFALFRFEAITLICAWIYIMVGELRVLDFINPFIMGFLTLFILAIMVLALSTQKNDLYSLLKFYLGTVILTVIFGLTIGVIYLLKDIIQIPKSFNINYIYFGYAFVLIPILASILTVLFIELSPNISREIKYKSLKLSLFFIAGFFVCSYLQYNFF